LAKNILRGPTRCTIGRTTWEKKRTRTYKMTMETAHARETVPARENRHKNEQVCISNDTLPHNMIVFKYEKEGNDRYITINQQLPQSI